MILATKAELCAMTGREMHQLECWLSWHGLKAVCREKNTVLALYDVDEYNDLVCQINARTMLAMADTTGIAPHEPAEKKPRGKRYDKRTVRGNIMWLRDKRKFPAMRIARELNIEMAFVIRVLEKEGKNHVDD